MRNKGITLGCENQQINLQTCALHYFRGENCPRIGSIRTYLSEDSYRELLYSSALFFDLLSINLDNIFRGQHLTLSSSYDNVVPSTIAYEPKILLSILMPVLIFNGICFEIVIMFSAHDQPSIFRGKLAELGKNKKGIREIVV